MPKIFHRLQVLVNDLKALGEEVKDKDFSHKLFRCLPSRFGTLVTILAIMAFHPLKSINFILSRAYLRMKLDQMRVNILNAKYE